MSDTITKSMSRMNKPELYEYAKDLKKELLKIILFNIVLEEDNTKLKIRLGIDPSHKSHSDSDSDSDSESEGSFTFTMEFSRLEKRAQEKVDRDSVKEIVKEIIEKVVQDEEEDDENVALFIHEGIKYDINLVDHMVLEKETSHQMGYWEPDKNIVDWLSKEERKMHIDKKIFEESLRRPKQLDYDTTDYK